MMVDEADLDVVGLGGGRGTKRTLSDAGSSPRQPPANRRKPGPLPRDFSAGRRSSISERTPPPSPVPPVVVLSPTPPPPVPPTPPVIEIPAPACNGTQGKIFIN